MLNVGDLGHLQEDQPRRFGEKTGAGGGIVGSIKSAVTGVKNWAGKAVTKVKNVASDAWGTVKGWFGFAEGGVVNQPTKAIIGEGQYPEAVVPLPDGRTIPVTIQGGGASDNSDLLPCISIAFTE